MVSVRVESGTVSVRAESGMVKVRVERMVRVRLSLGW